MLQIDRDTNQNFILWDVVKEGELPCFTATGPVNWRHELPESPPWPPEPPRDALPAWEVYIESTTPSDEALANLAQKNPPPREWFESSEECPF